MRQEIERFQARADDGTLHTVIARQVVIRSRQLGGTRTAKGSVDYVTLDGRDLDPIDDDTFEIVTTGQTVRRMVD